MTGLSVKVFAVAFLAAGLMGCVSLDLFGGSGVDSSISTGSISSPASNAPASDDVTVRNAVSSADLSHRDSLSLPWANTATGSAGVVSNISEVKNNNLTCRDFETTRHSYNGIAYFEGQTCRSGSGEWLITRFAKK
jgi:hypothetical protein